MECYHAPQVHGTAAKPHPESNQEELKKFNDLSVDPYAQVLIALRWVNAKSQLIVTFYRQMAEHVVHPLLAVGSRCVWP
jgi:hypothetical protein